MNSQLPELSALFDGEIEPHEIRKVVRSALHDDESRSRWDAYALIGDRLRGEHMDAAGMTADVMAKVRDEPVVLAPRVAKMPARPHPLLALAASVAGVVMVSWLAFTGDPRPSESSARLAAVPTAPSFKTDARQVQSSFPVLAKTEAGVTDPRSRVAGTLAGHGEMSEYLLAHHAQAASFRLGDGTQHIRTVTMTGRDGNP